MGLFNLARMTVSSSGPGTITLNAAVTGFLTFDLSGCSTAAAGQSITYAVADTTQSEIATGTYFSSSLTVTRGSSTVDLKSTNSNSPISMSNAAQVFITPGAFNMPAFNRVQTFSANGTYTPSGGMIYCVIEGVGGGAGGAGAVGSSASCFTGSGGSGAVYARKYATASAIGTSQAITIGAAGAGGVGAAVGSSGGTTGVGALCIAHGGNAGPSVGGFAFQPSAAAGSITGTGDIVVAGQIGMAGLYANGTGGLLLPSGGGGGSVFGVGGLPVSTNASALNGSAGVGYGAGGSGGSVQNSTATVNGGAGTAGYVFIAEFCSR